MDFLELGALYAVQKVTTWGGCWSTHNGFMRVTHPNPTNRWYYVFFPDTTCNCDLYGARAHLELHAVDINMINGLRPQKVEE